MCEFKRTAWAVSYTHLQADVGKALSMTQVQVSRREKKILSRLREMLAE